MGWASGSRLFSTVIKAAKKHIKDENVRQKLYEDLIPEFEKVDWDTQNECMDEDKAYDEAIKKLHPGWGF